MRVRIVSEPEFYEVKNWDRFQYREKSKPGALRWIKFYPDLLSDPAFNKLSDFNKGAWCMLLLIAARNEGKIPNDPDYLKRRLGFFRCPKLAAFEAAGFLLRPTSIQSRSNLDPTSIQPRSDLDPTSTQTRSNEIQEHQRVTAQNCERGWRVRAWTA